jgi:Putative beta barrel porin-7 (BBP7)
MLIRAGGKRWLVLVTLIVATANRLWAQDTSSMPRPLQVDGQWSSPPVPDAQPPEPTFLGPDTKTSQVQVTPEPTFAAPPPGSGPPPASEPPSTLPPISGPAPAGPYGPPPYGPPPGAPVLPPYPPPGSPLIFAPPIEPARFWINTEYLLWWTKSAPLPTPLVSIGSPSDPVPGALGQPGTQVVLGGQNVDFNPASGVRLAAGWWFDAKQTFGIEGGVFVLGQQGADFSAFSNPFGSPLIARPVTDAQNGAQIAYWDSAPGALAGGPYVTMRSQFFGWDLDGTVKLYQLPNFRVDGLLGFRYLNLTESLQIVDQFTALSPGLTFVGQPVAAGSNMVDFDYFKTTNNFYGGQLGTRIDWTTGRWEIEALAKFAMGTSQERTVINGGTTLFPVSGGSAGAVGGVLATTANIGNYYQSPFAFVPEIDLNFTYHITPNLSARIGYSFIYWSDVVRAGNQVSPVVSPNLVPSDPSYGTAGPNAPSYAFQTTSYWAQGLNLGLELQF